MRWLSCFVIGAALVLAGCSRDIVQDSAALDRALVPAVDLTSHGEHEPARAAMAGLDLAWKDFAARYRAHRPEDAEWGPAFALLDTLVADVIEIVEDGDLEFAAENLIDMRMLLAELRERAGIEYIPDMLGELWEPLDELYLLAKRRSEEEVLTGDDSALSVLFRELDALLGDLLDAELDPNRFGFDPVRTAAFFSGLEALDAAAGEIEQALEASEYSRALATARNLRPLYYDIYRLFGDYDIPLLADEER